MPLVCELVFLLVLSGLLNQAESIAAQEANSKSIIFEADRFSRKFLEAGMFLFLYKSTGNPTFEKNYNAFVDVLPSECRNLKARTNDHPAQKRVVEHIEGISKKSIALLQEIRSTMDEGVSPASNLLHMVDLNKELESTLTELNEEIHKLIEAEAAVVRASPESGRRSRYLVQLCIAAGVVLNIAIAVGLAIYFNTSTIRRLKSLVENTLLLSKQQPLKPILDGTDEIAQLDKSFHEMAFALQESADKERAMFTALQTSEERIRSIVASMPVGLVIATADGTIELVNDRIREMFGYESNELIGKHLKLISPQAETLDQKVWMQTLEQKATGRVVETEAQKKNGSIFAVDISIDDLQEPDCKRLLVNIMDATERHAIEKLKKELVAIVSHDLRTPLSSVQMNLAFLVAGGMGQMPDKANKLLQSSELQINRLIKLVKDLLDIEKIESGTVDLQFRTINIDSIIKLSIESVQSIAHDKNLEIEFEGCDTAVNADEDRLMQVLVNLLSNAVKYSNPNDKIQVQAGPVDNFLEVRVIDHGRGIPASHKDLIFERFQQVDSRSDQREKGGTGLGLAICKALIQQHGGLIGVESEENKGSSFWFRLPLSAATQSNQDRSMPTGTQDG